jgi:hypothetical protein
LRASVLIVLFATVIAARAQPARIILIRHAEKPANELDPNLSAEGQVRAQRLTTWLSEERVSGPKSAPAAFYAPEPGGRGGGVRCRQTLEPTARHLNLPIHTPHRPDEYQKLARQLLRDNSLNGKIVVVCWPHTELPGLAAALGVKPEPPRWKDKDFDSAYVITFRSGDTHLKRIKQKLKIREQV